MKAELPLGSPTQAIEHAGHHSATLDLQHTPLSNASPQHLLRQFLRRARQPLIRSTDPRLSGFPCELYIRYPAASGEHPDRQWFFPINYWQTQTSRSSAYTRFPGIHSPPYKSTLDSHIEANHDHLAARPKDEHMNPTSKALRLTK